MRKVKILSLILAIVMLAVTFASCGVCSYESVFNDDYDLSAKPVSEVKTISELEGYTFENSNEYFAIFKKATSEGSASITHKVYSFVSQSVVGVFTTTDTYSYDIRLCGNIPGFVTVGSKIKSGESTEETSVTMTLYNEKGTSVASADERVTAKAVGNMYIFNYAAYIVGEEGTIQKKMDIPEYLMIDNINDSNDEYIYYFDDGEVETENEDGETVVENSGDVKVVIYNTEFIPVATWTLPTYADLVEDMFVLENGDVLVQYTKKIDPLAEEFDLYDFDNKGNVAKYDLVTLIIEADGGDTDEVDLEYIVSSLITNSELYDENEDNNYYNDSFDNMAIVNPIIDGEVDYSDSATDIVVMDNDGDISGSLKLVEGQMATLPKMIDEGIYIVDTAFGQAVVDDGGDVIQYINNDVSVKGRYIVTSRAIYDSEMTKVYDLKANKASVVGAIDDTIFIKQKSGSSNAIIAYKAAKYNDGTEIKRTVTSSTASEEFALRSEIGGYQLYDKTTSKYNYYTVDGKLIKSFDSSVSAICASSYTDDVIMSYVSEGKTCFCLFVK